MRKIALPDQGAETLFGTYDENLKHLESLFNVRIRTSGQELVVEGDASDVARAERVLDQLSSLMRGGYRLGKGDVRTASQLVAQDDTVDLSDYFLNRRGPQASARSFRRASTSAAISMPSRRTTSSSASARREPARPTWPWPRPSRSCSRRK